MMFASRKRIFAGKQRLQAEPFCPCLTDANGYSSLAELTTTNRPVISAQPHRRPSQRDGKR